jgi:response regulator RpfG family c-di-GMP phosphodiesterase
MKHKLLVVDDEPAITRMLERLLREEFDVVTALSGPEALELLTVHDIALIISDQRMPGMTGVEFLKRSADIRPHCVRIILTGYTDAADLVEAINSGVIYKYVTKPWENTDLMQTVKRGLSHHETIRAQHRLNLEIQRVRQRLQASERSVLNLCSAILRIKNVRIHERAERVRDLSMIVGRAMEMDTESLETLSLTGSLFAIAELYVPRALCGHNPLKQSYAALVDGARERGLELLADVPSLEEVVTAIRYVTENFDGTGTPSGLMGVQIPLASRIVAVVKAFDEMVFPDTSAIALGDDAAMARLRSESGTRYDPEVVKAFCGMMGIEEGRRVSRAPYFGPSTSQSTTA